LWWRWHSQFVAGSFIVSRWHNRLSQPTCRVERSIHQPIRIRVAQHGSIAQCFAKHVGVRQQQRVDPCVNIAKRVSVH
jgi:hypothetical protein